MTNLDDIRRDGRGVTCPLCGTLTAISSLRFGGRRMCVSPECGLAGPPDVLEQLTERLNRKVPP